ncbi:MAG: hypothetical protein RR444_11530 [Oscillospiraceae bacterium]
MSYLEFAVDTMQVVIEQCQMPTVELRRYGIGSEHYEDYTIETCLVISIVDLANDTWFCCTVVVKSIDRLHILNRGNSMI